MTTPWERELAEKKKQDENEHMTIPLMSSTTKAMKSRPRSLFYASLTAIAVNVLAAMYAYSIYKYGVDPISGLYWFGLKRLFILVLPLSCFVLALCLRFLFMKEVAREVSKKIARMTKCSPDLERALYVLMLSSPWSRYGLRRYTWGKEIPRFSMRVTSEFGESRTIRFSRDLSSIVVGPERWTDNIPPTFWELLSTRGRSPWEPMI